jgi:hypothetical protein
MAALPKQVEQDLMEIEEYEKSLASPVAEETPDPTTPAPEAQPPEPPVPSEPAPEVVAPPQDRVWEQKYRTLEGKYQAEVPRLHATNKDLQRQIDELKAEPPTAVALTPESLVTEKDVTDYGQDLIDVQRRVAREELAPLKAELAKRDTVIAELRTALDRNTGEVSTVSFESRLAKAVPEFEQLNADPKWIAWLDENDPYTGEPRRYYAEFVYNSGDVAKLKTVVDFYLKSTSTEAPPPDSRQQRQAELERQITPTRTTSTAQTTTPASTRIFTEAQATKLFDDVRRMNIAGEYDKAAKLEAELSDAYMQGRVRG